MPFFNQLWYQGIVTAVFALLFGAALVFSLARKNKVLVNRLLTWAIILGVYSGALAFEVFFGSTQLLLSTFLLAALAMILELYRLNRLVGYLSIVPLLGWAWIVFMSSSVGFAVFLAVAAFDIGGWIGGKTLSRFRGFDRRIMPKTSPNKTFGGFVVGTVLAGAVLVPMFWQYLQLAALGVWLLTAGLAFSGDYLESKIKRHAGVKDAGTLLPGFGGLLDRFDSFIPVGIALLSWLPAVIESAMVASKVSA